MSRMIKFLSIAVILFSVAAGASWYLQYSQHPDEEPIKTTDEKANAKAKSLPGKGAAPEAASNRSLPRPPMSPEVDKIAKTAAALQLQQESLKTREQQLIVREKQLDTIHNEIKKEHKKLDSVRKEIEGELAVVMEKLDLLESAPARSARQGWKLTPSSMNSSRSSRRSSRPKPRIPSWQRRFMSAWKLTRRRRAFNRWLRKGSSILPSASSPTCANARPRPF